MWPFKRRTACASEEAIHSAEQADRALADAHNLNGRLEKVARQAAEIRRVNHIAAAVAKTLKGT